MTNEQITIALHTNPCAGCKCEPEVIEYYRDTISKVRCGYLCSCGAVVVRGALVGTTAQDR